jgi:hypothetical protein
MAAIMRASIAAKSTDDEATATADDDDEELSCMADCDTLGGVACVAAAMMTSGDDALRFKHREGL